MRRDFQVKEEEYDKWDNRTGKNFFLISAFSKENKKLESDTLLSFPCKCLAYFLLLSIRKRSRIKFHQIIEEKEKWGVFYILHWLIKVTVDYSLRLAETVCEQKK